MGGIVILNDAHSAAAMARYERLTEIAESGTGSSVFYAGRQQETVGRLIWQQKHGTGGSEMDSVTYLRQFESCDDIGNGDFSRIYQIADEYAAMQAENERLKAERVDLEQFRDAVFFWISETEKLPDTPPKRGLEVYGNRLLALIDAHKGE